MAAGSQYSYWVVETSDAIIAAGLDPLKWQEIPRRFANSWPGTAVVIQGADACALRCIGVLETGMRADFLEPYQKHFSQINPWMRHWKGMPTMLAFNSDDQLPASELVHTEFYNDFIRTHGEIDCASGLKVFDQADRFAWIAVHYGQQRAEQYNRLMPHLLQQIGPALRAAVILNREVSGRISASASLDSVLDALAHPAFLLDGAGHIRSANRQGADFFQTSDGLSRTARGKLLVGDADAAARLLAVLARLQRGEILPADIPIRSSDGALEGILSVLPASGSEFPAMSWLFAPDRLAIAIFRKAAARAADASALLQSAFGLTAAEARLTSQLAAGMSLSSVAEEFCMSKETLRTQLKSIFAKTRTHRQSELVSLVSRLSAL